MSQYLCTNFMCWGCKDHPAVLHSDYHGDERATTGGRYLNITCLGNKLRCRISAWICSYCSVFVYPGESPALSFHRTIRPHYDGASPKMRLGKQSETETGIWSTKAPDKVCIHMLALDDWRNRSLIICFGFNGESCLGSQPEIVWKPSRLAYFYMLILSVLVICQPSRHTSNVRCKRTILRREIRLVTVQIR